jgi:hypothetical protein
MKVILPSADHGSGRLRYWSIDDELAIRTSLSQVLSDAATHSYGAQKTEPLS